MSGDLIALATAFAFGALITLDATDRHATPCKPEPAPAVKPVRQAFTLTHPLACERGWIKNCADFEQCKESCL